MALDYLKDELRALADHHALRRPEAARVPTARDIDFTSNDYLGAARGHVSRATSDGSVPPRRRPRTAHRLRPHGPQPLHGTGASRLVHGTHPLHELLEQGLASWVQQPAALLFASGYAANLGALSALAQPEDLIISDELNHASIIDGCRLSRAQLRVVPHLDLTAVESALKQPARRRWVVCESYYSMDGDMADLPALRRLCDQHGAYLYVDEAHALGVFGPNGSGLCARSGVKPEVLIGTLGKALGSHGAFVAGEDALRLWLWNRARSFVFSTATAPSAALQTLQLLHWAQHAEDARRKLQDNCQLFTSEAARLRLPVPHGLTGPVFPFLVGDNSRTLALAERARREGLLLQPIRPPTVPQGTARLRITLSARHSTTEIHLLLQVLERAWAEP